MSSTLIHYFTGTGNTAYAVRLIFNELKKAGHEVSIVQVGHGVEPPEGIFDDHIVAFPVLSWAPPVMMSRYLKKMPRLKETKVAILAINGSIVRKGKLISGYTGQALEEAERILKRKKMDVFLTGNASFPDNWTQMTNPSNEEDMQRIFPPGETQVLEFTTKFLSEKRELYRCGAFNTVWSYVISGGFGRIGRRVLGTFYIADSNCTGCGICAKTCPAQTIVLKNKRPYWKTHCEDCNRCINICPEKAIQVSVPLMILQLSIHLLMSVWFVKSVLDYASLLIADLVWLRILVDIPLVLLAFYLAVWVTLVPLDALFRWIQKIPAVHRFFTKSYTQSFRRYSAPGFKPWKET